MTEFLCSIQYCLKLFFSFLFHFPLLWFSIIFYDYGHLRMNTEDIFETKDYPFGESCKNYLSIVWLKYFNRIESIYCPIISVLSLIVIGRVRSEKVLESPWKITKWNIWNFIKVERESFVMLQQNIFEHESTFVF